MDQILTELNMKSFHRKFYKSLKESPYISLIEIYDDEYRISFKKRNIIYYNIFNYCVNKMIDCNAYNLTLTNGEERYRMIIKF